MIGASVLEVAAGTYGHGAINPNSESLTLTLYAHVRLRSRGDHGTKTLINV